MPQTTETLSLGFETNPMMQGFRKVGMASKQFASKFSASMDTVSRTARKTGLILSASLTAPIVLMGRSAVKAFFAQEDAIESLRSALGGAGKEVNSLTRDFAVYAAGLQKVTIYGDELLISQAAYMKNLGVEAGLLKEATKAAVGLAARYRIDLQTAAMLVGRASKGQTQMLTRYGIVIAETLSPQEKFNELLRIGADNFRLAEDAAKTTSGQMKQAANAFGDMKESVGAMIVTGLNFNAVAGKIVEVSKAMKKWFEGLSPATRTVLSVVLLITAALGPLALGISAVTFVLGKLSIALIAIKGITLASAGAFAILAAKILLVVAAFKAGQWIGARIRRLWTNEAELEKMARAMKKVADETGKLNKEFSELVKLNNVGIQGESVLTAWERQAAAAKGVAKEIATSFNVELGKMFKVSIHNIDRMTKAMGAQSTAELLALRQSVQQTMKMNQAMGVRETPEAIVSRLRVQTEGVKNLMQSMRIEDFTRMLSGSAADTAEMVRIVQALSGGVTEKADADDTAATGVSAKKATLAVAGSIEAYRAEVRGRDGVDKMEAATVETASNTAETNTILTKIARNMGSSTTFNGVLGIA